MFNTNKHSVAQQLQNIFSVMYKICMYNTSDHLFRIVVPNEKPKKSTKEKKEEEFNEFVKISLFLVTLNEKMC